MARAFCLSVLVAALAGLATADTIILQDGRVIEGKLLTPADSPVVKIDTPAGTLRSAR